MSPRLLFKTGIAGTVFVAATLLFMGHTSGADYSATQAGTINITFDIPDLPVEPTPEPEPTTPPLPFDWNWTYPAPTCEGVTVKFPTNLPAGQQGVMEVNVTGGSISGMQYKLEGGAYKAAYPNGHAGKTVFIPWGDFRNYRIPSTQQWTVTALQVHGTNFHWSGRLICGKDAKKLDTKATAPTIQSTPAPEPAPVPTQAPDSTPTPPPAPVETKAPAAPVIPDPAPVKVKEEAPVVPDETAPTPEPQPAPEHIVQVAPAPKQEQQTVEPEGIISSEEPLL